MYICKNCGSVFSTPVFAKNKSKCPDCDSKNFAEATQCRICKNYFIGNNYQDYCDDCRLDAEEQLRRAVDKMVDKDYAELLCDEYSDLEFIIKGDDA